jgi:hypothetical protein
VHRYAGCEGTGGAAAPSAGAFRKRGGDADRTPCNDYPELIEPKKPGGEAGAREIDTKCRDNLFFVVYFP